MVRSGTLEEHGLEFLRVKAYDFLIHRSFLFYMVLNPIIHSFNKELLLTTRQAVY